MKKRKILACLCCAAMLFSATACAGVTDETTTTTTEAVTSGTTEASKETSATSETSATTSETTTTASETTTETSEDEDDYVDDDEKDPAYDKVAALPEKDAYKDFDKLEDSDVLTGTVLGINKAGDTVYALFEKKVSLSEKQVKAFKVGDSIGYKDTEAEGSPDLKVAKIEKDGKHLSIELKTSDDPEDYCEWSINWNNKKGCYEITGSSDIVYSEEIGYMAVALAPDCKITEGYEVFTDDDVKEDYKKAEKTGIPVFDTLFWFSETHSPYNPEYLYKLGENGWYCTDSFFNATVKNGKIVKIRFYTM
jgi:hypothetical protein